MTSVQLPWLVCAKYRSMNKVPEVPSLWRSYVKVYKRTLSGNFTNINGGLYRVFAILTRETVTVSIGNILLSI